MKRINFSLVILLLFSLPAWAGQRWYLLTPPSYPADPRNKSSFSLLPKETAPLKQWKELSVFGTAKDCSSYKEIKSSELQKQANELAKKRYLSRSKGETEYMESYDLEFTYVTNLKSEYESSQCIASDDGRLK